MFYRPAEGHGLPHSPFSAIVSPRPIGWISTRASTGDNLAPYSFFNAVCESPLMLAFSSQGPKDSATFAGDAGESYTDVDWTVPSAVVLGAEGTGLRRLVRERCDRLVRLPMLGSVSSLNVSVAAGVVLYEAVRQRAGRHSG